MNPYTVGTSVSGIDFYDRSEILEELNSFDEINYFLNGIRRIGKSSILLQLALILKQERAYIPIYCSLQGCNSNIEMGEQLRLEVNHLLSELNKISVKWNPNDVSFETSLEDWINYCQENKVKSFLLFDESEQFHLLDSETISKLSALFSNTKDNIKIILAGTRKFFQIEGRSELIAFSNLFRSRHVGHVDYLDVKNIITQCQQNEEDNVMATDEQIENIYKYCGGHPYLIQFVCDECFNIKSRTLKKEANGALVSSEQLDNCFKDDFEYLNQNQQIILLFLANKESASQMEISKGTGLSERIIDQESKELKYLGYLEPVSEKYLIKYLLFKDWLKDTLAKSEKPKDQITKLKIVTLFARDAYDYFSDMKKNCLELLHLHFEHWDVEDILIGNTEMILAQKIEEADIIIGLLSPNFFEENSETERFFQKCKSSERFVPILATTFLHEYLIDPKVYHILPRKDSIEYPLQKWEIKGDAYRQISEKLLAIKKKHT